MKLLQAAIAAGLFILAPAGLVLLLIFPRLVRLIMERIWWLKGRYEDIKNKVPFYNDPLSLLFAVVMSVTILGGVMYAFIIILDRFWFHGNIEV